MRTVLTNATLIDCVSPVPRANATVEIDEGRIAAIRIGAPERAGDATLIDLKGTYLLPGLWDVHIHPDFFASTADMPLPEQVTLFGHKMSAALTESGITGMRSAGAHHYMDVAWKRGFKVMAHATNPEAVKSAIRLGAHSVEHGYILDEECIALFLKHDVWYVPTLAISHLTPNQANNEWESRWVKQRNLAHALCCRADGASGEHVSAFTMALKAGVKMAVGSDIRPLKDAALLEMGLWVRDGATPWQTLVAATRNAAAVCGVGADLGTVETGKVADLIVVEKNPLENINNLRRLQLVFKDGRVVSDKRR